MLKVDDFMKKKILIVEDEGITAFELETKIKRWGYVTVGTAVSVEDALKMAREMLPDLVILDIRLQGEQDGIEFAEIIKKEMDIPIIYVTAHSSDLILERAKKTVPHAYIVKPFDDKEIKFAVEMAFYKFAMEKKLKESEQRFKDLLNSLPVGVFITDLDGNILYINNSLAGVSGDNVLENVFGDTGNNNLIDIQELKSIFNKLKKDGEINNQKFKRLNRNGDEMEFTFSAKVKNDNIYGFIGPKSVYKNLKFI